jgi:hypothetical protein
MNNYKPNTAVVQEVIAPVEISAGAFAACRHSLDIQACDCQLNKMHAIHITLLSTQLRIARVISGKTIDDRRRGHMNVS